ncbi:hypothetical protein, partial [Bacillus safensis]|uniref:hypothetical protein n=1 Tax=Bacillus safensis TaxID=561879 RepID=UPI00364B22D0
MSTQYMTPESCRRFAATVTGLGGTVPAPLTKVLNDFDVVTGWSPSIDFDQVRRTAQAGTLTADDLTAACTAPTIEVTAAIRQSATYGLINRFAVLLAGDAGDTVVTSVRPAFDEAADVVRAAAGLFSPSTTAEQILEMGEEAA